ncbi:MAG TPA: extracellular solute-binding protein, partial [Paenibacillus sp.]|nr:extracellular solute-binding protein [Paenibacillus sp.]
ARGSYDVVYVPDGWLPALVERGKVRPLSSIGVSLADDPCPPSIQARGAYRGVQYGAPAYGAVWCLLTNRELLREAGVESVPETWEELAACAEALREHAPDVVPYGLPDDSDGHFIDHGAVYAFAGGLSRWADDDGRCTADNEWTAKGLAFLRSLIDRGLANVPVGMPSAKLFESFLSGGVAMTIGPSDVALTRRAAEAGFTLDVSLVPYPIGGRPLSLASFGLYCVSAASERPDLAAALVRRLTAPDESAGHVRTIGMLPVRSAGAAAAADERLSVFAAQLERSALLPTWQLPYVEWFNEEALSCLRGERSPEKAVAAFARRIRQALPELHA